MREVIFRGRRIDNWKWVEIEIFKGCKGFEEWVDGVGPVISFVDTSTGNSKKWCRANVDPETIGQYTGLKDKSGKRIFDGDILMGYNTYKFKVCIEDGHTVIKWEDQGEKLAENLEDGYIKENDVEIIGNRWDSPELLEVQ